MKEYKINICKHCNDLVDYKRIAKGYGNFYCENCGDLKNEEVEKIIVINKNMIIDSNKATVAISNKLHDTEIKLNKKNTEFKQLLTKLQTMTKPKLPESKPIPEPVEDQKLFDKMLSSLNIKSRGDKNEVKL